MADKDDPEDDDQEEPEEDDVEDSDTDDASFSSVEVPSQARRMELDQGGDKSPDGRRAKDEEVAKEAAKAAAESSSESEGDAALSIMKGIKAAPGDNSAPTSGASKAAPSSAATAEAAKPAAAAEPSKPAAAAEPSKPAAAAEPGKPAAAPKAVPSSSASAETSTAQTTAPAPKAAAAPPASSTTTTSAATRAASPPKSSLPNGVGGADAAPAQNKEAKEADKEGFTLVDKAPTPAGPPLANGPVQPPKDSDSEDLDEEEEEEEDEEDEEEEEEEAFSLDAALEELGSGPVLAPWESTNALTEAKLLEIEEEVQQRWQKRHDNVDRRISFEQCRLEDWKEFLEPYSWQTCEKECIRVVLEKAGLLFDKSMRQMDMVYEYEMLRCLGGKLVSPPADAQAQVQAHLRANACGDGKEAASKVFKALTRELRQSQSGGNFNETLGFSLADVRQRKLPLRYLAQLALPHIQCVPQANGSRGQQWELVNGWVQEALRESTAEDNTTLRRHLQAFLVEVAEQYLRSEQNLRARIEQEKQEWKGVATQPIDFEKSTRFAALKALEPDAEAKKKKACEGLTADQGARVLNLLRVAWAEHCSNLPRNLQLELPWALRRWFDVKAKVLDPSKSDARNRDLSVFFVRNQKWRVLHAQAAMSTCVTRALLKVEHRPEAPKFVRGVAARKVIVFGLLAESKRAGPNQTPVIVKQILLEVENASIGAQLREIGVRLAGTYRWLEIKSQEEGDVRYVEWLPPGRVEETAKPLEAVLDGATHVRLYLPGDEEPEPIEVSLTNALEFRADSLAYRVIPSMPRDSGSPAGSFRRVLVQVCRDGHLDVPPAMLNGTGAGLRGFAETGEVLAQTIALYLGPGKSLGVEELQRHLERTPRLLYFASMGLLNTVLGPRVREAIRIHWERELQLNVAGKFPMTVEQRESRVVLRELLLARGQETGDRTCAAVPVGHLPEIYEMLKRTKHPHVALSIERCNFEARARDIEAKLVDSAITFIIVTVTGSMSPLQLGSLVQRARGCLRLIFVAYPSLQRSLALTRSHDKVLLAESLGGFGDLLMPSEYKKTSPVGSAVIEVHNLLLAKPQGLGQKSKLLPWTRNWQWLEANLRCATRWRQEAAAWKASGETLLCVVTPDDQLVAAYYGSSDVRFFDADEAADSGMQPFSQLDALLERTPRKLRGHENDDETAQEEECSSLLVLFNHHLVLQSKIEDVVSRCHLKNFQLVLVVREAPTTLRRVRVHLPGHSTMHVQSKVLYVRASIDDLVAQVAVQPEDSEKVKKLLQGLRLVFGPEKMTIRMAQAVVATLPEGLESHSWRDVVTNLAGSSSSEEQLEVAQDVLRALLGLKAEKYSVAYLVGKRCAECSTEIDVAFSEFVRMPLCRLLSQVNRLEAWLRYLVPPSRSEEEVHKVASFAPTGKLFNCQSNELMHLLASAGEERDNRAMLPLPSYIGTGPADSTVSKEEMYMQCALQGRDLDWETFVEQWGARKPPDASDVAALLETSPDVMKLSLCITPNSLVHLKEALVSGDIPPALRRLRVHFLNTVDVLESAVNGARAAAGDGGSVPRGIEILQDRMAAMKYVLLTLEPTVEELARDKDLQEPIGELSVVELNRLFRYHIKLNPGAQGSVWVGKLLAVDEPRELLVEQTEVRRFLLQGDSELFAQELAKDPVGAAFITLLTTPHIRQKLSQDDRCPVLQVPLFAHIINWLDDRVGEEDTEETLSRGADRLSAKAFATLLVHSPTSAALQKLVNTAVWTGCAGNSQKRADVINALAHEKGAEHLVVPVLEAIVQREGDFQREQVADGEHEDESFRDGMETQVPAYAALYSALKTRNLAPYLEMEDAPALALDASPRLLEMYVEYFRKWRLDEGAELDKQFWHFQRLSEPSCTAVGTRLLADREAPRLLLWYCWARDPSLVLSTSQFPQAEEEEERPIFLSVLRCADFRMRALEVGVGLSAAARMIVKPHTLPLAVFNLFAPMLSWIHRAPPAPLDEKLLLVAQEGHTDYPPYCLRWHYRPLPQALKDKLKSTMRGTVQPMAAGVPLQKLYPRITEGVSPETFAHNLRLLFGLNQAPQQGQGSYNAFVAAHKAMLAACILVWFRAQGMSKEDLVTSVTDSSHATFHSVWENLRQTQTDDMRGNCTAGPLPTYIDVKWLDTDHVVRTPLFAISKSSAQFTAQWLNNLCVHARLDIPTFNASDLVEVSGAKGRDVRPGRRYEGALETVAAAWGRAVAAKMVSGQLVTRVNRAEEAEATLDTSALTTHFSLLADFSRLLRDQRSRLEALLRKLVGGLAEGLMKAGASEKKIAENSAGVYDVLFLLFGVTPENNGVEMRMLTAEFKAKNLKGSKQAITEMDWLHSNFYDAEDETKANLGQLLKTGMAQHGLKRHFGQSIPITKLTNGNDRLDSAITLEDPSYLDPLHFKLCFDNEDPQQQAEAAAALTMQRSASGMEAGPAPVITQRETARRACFFTKSSEAAEAQVTGQEREPLRIANEGRATVAASDLLSIETSSSFYLYACIRIAPGLQPLLLQEAADEAVFRLTSMETTPVKEQRTASSGSLTRVFASNADAWKYLDSLAPQTTLMADGFYLTKADDGRSWVPIFATNRDSRAGNQSIVWQNGESNGDELRVVDQKLCIWPLVHSHDLVSLDLDMSVRRLLELIVVLAFHLTESRPAEEAQALPRQIERDAVTALKAALEKVSRASVEVEGGPRKEQKDRSAAWLARYQQHEVRICICLQEILQETSSKGTVDDLIDVVKEVCKKPDLNGLPFVQDSNSGGKEATELGLYLARQLTMVWCKIDPRPRKQLHAVLAKGTASKGSNVFPTTLGAEKKVVAHHRITLKTFEQRGLELLGKLTRPAGSGAWGYEEGFTDSEVESDMGEGEAILDDAGGDTVERRSEGGGSTGRGVTVLTEQALEHQATTYADSALDRSRATCCTTCGKYLKWSAFYTGDYAEGWDCDNVAECGNTSLTLGPSRWMCLPCRKDLCKYCYEASSSSSQEGSCIFNQATGYGRPSRSKYVVMTLYDADCPHYFVGLDTGKLKIQYSMEDGLPLGYMIHKDLAAGLLESAYRKAEEGEKIMLALRDRLLGWIANILRSPISDDLKAWILRKVETQGRNPQTPPSSSVNSLVIAYSLCSCCPQTTPEAQFLRRVLTESLTSACAGITPTIRRYIRRKEQYGIYIVKGGTLFELQKLFGQENVAVRDFEREVSQRAVSINWMYLDIIKRFTGFTCIVYIQGLRIVEDALLKWLAEYTRHHTWRFVFFENVDASWNFSENRDRCDFSFAPESLSTIIRTTADLLTPKIAAIRPSHIAEYDCCPTRETCRDHSELLNFFKQKMPGDFLDTLPKSNMVGDFRGELRELLERPDPCVVLVVSPPGAGKTFFMEDLRAKLERGQNATIAQFDGSSDVLVTHTIVELLDSAVGGHGERVLLILDEYHMLGEAQKAQLFEWIEEKAAALQVVLIANRIDSKDRERVKACALKVRLIETRLSRAVLDEKLESIGASDGDRTKVRLWYVASRLVFGEEAISLRLVDPIVEALQRPNPQSRLREILLAKMPTISMISADHFVAAFLARVGSTGFAGGPFATLFNIAALDEGPDELCSIMEFVARMPRELQCAAPQARQLCWCSYVLAQKKWAKSQNARIDDSFPFPGNGDGCDAIFNLGVFLEYEYVDQVGTPFQLREPAVGNSSRGRAFSWSGDYESLDDIIDAVKRGHSIDWHDLHERHWKKTTVTESEKVCMLLSTCRNPGACLEALTPGNLALLLRSSSPENAVIIARHTLRNKVHEGSREAPYPQALWSLILNDGMTTSPMQLSSSTDDVSVTDLQTSEDGGPISVTVDGTGPTLAPNLLSCMLWAQEHAGDHRQINGQLDAGTREDLLQRTLTLATVFGGGSTEVQGQLWSGVFAQLLVTPTEETDGEWRKGPTEGRLFPPPAQPIECLRGWLSYRESFERDWPVDVRNLWSILRCKAPASAVNTLWTKNRALLLEPASTKISSLVIVGIFHNEGGEIDKELQRSILTGGLVIPPELSNEDILRVTDTALRLIQRTELPPGSDPRLVELVEQEIARRDSG